MVIIRDISHFFNKPPPSHTKIDKAGVAWDFLITFPGLEAVPFLRHWDAFVVQRCWPFWQLAIILRVASFDDRS